MTNSSVYFHFRNGVWQRMKLGTPGASASGKPLGFLRVRHSHCTCEKPRVWQKTKQKPCGRAQMLLGKQNKKVRKRLRNNQDLVVSSAPLAKPKRFLWLPCSITNTWIFPQTCGLLKSYRVTVEDSVDCLPIAHSHLLLPTRTLLLFR